MSAPKELRQYEYVVLLGAPHQHSVAVFKLSHDDYEMLKSEEGFEPSVPSNVYGLLHYDVPLMNMMNALGQLGFHGVSAVDDEENAYIMERLSGNGNCTTCSCSGRRDIMVENTSHWLCWFLQ